MKYVLRALAAPLLAMAVPSAGLAQGETADSATLGERQQLAQEIVANGFPPESRMELFGGVMQQMVAQINVAQPQLQEDPEIQEIVERFQQRAIATGMETLANHMDPMMDGLALAYADIYNLDELRAFHAFVTSPEGHGFLAKSSAATAHPAFAQANQGYMNEYMAQLPALQQELRAELTELLAGREEAPEAS